MKKIISLILICCMMATVFPVSVFAVEIVASGYCGGEGDGTNLMWELDSDGTLTISGTGEMAYFTHAGDVPWYRCESVETITIRNGVTSIGDYAFVFCDSLTSITIPDSVMSIGSIALPGCLSLTNIIVGVYNAAYCDVDGVLFTKNKATLVAYPGGKTATSYAIPSGVTSIGDHAFDDCDSLTTITIPDSVTSIGDHAFDDCDSLTTITIPDSVTSIGDYAFSECDSLTTITIPDSVTSIGDYAFSYCDSLTTITIPDVVTSIGDAVFCGCSSLTSITIPDGVTSIGDGVFNGCSSLTSITIPDGVTSIGDGVFFGCSSLTSITIPDGVTSIGEYTFYGCSSLTSITIPASVFYIEEYTFYGCSSLTSITIPYRVISIGHDAFYGCSSLTSITIPDGVTSIGEYTFYGCSSLTNIIIPDTIISIGDYAFAECTSLTSITIPDDIGECAFSGCSSLASITISNGWVSLNDDPYSSINESAFRDCSELTSITVNADKSNYCDIDGVLFTKDKTMLHTYPAGMSASSYAIPASVTTIGTYAFYNCRRLTSITVDANNAIYCDVDGVLFTKNKATLVTYPAGKTDSSYAIPAGVTSIGYYAFSYCESLTSITIPDGVPSIVGGVFSGCTSLTSITIPGSVTYIGYNAFSDCPNLTIHGYTGSTAETYAAEHDIPFVALDNPSTPTDTTYTRFGKLNAYDYTGTITIDGMTYTMSEEYKNSSANVQVMLPTNYLKDYYYIAYNLNGSGEITAASVMPGVVCKLEGWDAANKIVDTDHTPLTIGGTTALHLGKFTVSDVTASSFPSDQIGSWVGDSIRIYCVGEQIFKVIHVVEGEGEVTSYDKNNTPGVVLIDGVTYPVANDGFLRATIAYPFDNNSEYIKSAVFTMYDNVLVELQYTNYELDPNAFKEAIYRADILVTEKYDGKADIYDERDVLYSSILQNVYSSSNTLIEGLGGWMHGLSGAWQLITDGMDVLQGGSVADLALERRDTITAFLMQALKISNEKGIVDKYKTATKDVSTVIDLSADVISAFTKDSAGYKIYDWMMQNPDQKNKVKDTLYSYYKKNNPKIADIILSDKGMDVLDAVIKGADSIETLYERYIGYLELFALTDSMKNAVKQMYESCPDSEWDIKWALGEILPIIEASSESQFNKIITNKFTITITADVAKYAINELWSEIVDNVAKKHPVIAMVFAVYNVGEYAIDKIFGTGATVEQYFKMRSLVELENVVNKAASTIAQNYQNNSTQLNAETLLDIIEIKYTLLEVDSDEAIKYAKIVRDEGAIRKFANMIKDMLDKDDADELINTLEKMSKNIDLAHFIALTRWITALQNDCPSLLVQYRDFWGKMWEKYRPNESVEYLDGMFTDEEIQAGWEDLIDFGKQILQELAIKCPVNVFVYDSDGNLVAYAEDGIVKTSEFVSIITKEDSKYIYFLSDDEYSIVCEGYDDGTMDVTANQIGKDNKVLRTINYHNIVISNDSTHLINIDVDAEQTENNVTISDSVNKIEANYDSAIDNTEKHTITVENGYIITENGVEFQTVACVGEVLSIVAFVPEVGSFNGWSSNNSSVEFENNNLLSTKVVMADEDVIIRADIGIDTYYINAVGATGGTVRGSGNYCENSTVTLNAIPSEGYKFVHWAENGIVISNNSIYSFQATKNRDIIAVFEISDDTNNSAYIYWLLLQMKNQEYAVTATATEGGTITPDGTINVKYGKDLTYTITPDEGYAISDVLVDGKSVGAVSEYTIKRIKADHTITAIFIKNAWKNPYTDVSDEAWYYEDIKFVSENDLMIGTGDNKFSPEAIIDRATLVTVLWRLEGSPIVDSPITFVDVPASEWYTDAVKWASANGIVNGYGDGIFGAMNDLTHEQIMAILNRYAVYKKWSKNVSGNADDSYTNSEWAENNVLWADINGMFKEIGSDISNLTKGATRAELAAYLRRFCENVMK